MGIADTGPLYARIMMGVQTALHHLCARSDPPGTVAEVRVLFDGQDRKALYSKMNRTGKVSRPLHMSSVDRLDAGCV